MDISFIQNLCPLFVQVPRSDTVSRLQEFRHTVRGNIHCIVWPPHFNQNERGSQVAELSKKGDTDRKSVRLSFSLLPEKYLIIYILAWDLWFTAKPAPGSCLWEGLFFRGRSRKESHILKFSQCLSSLLPGRNWKQSVLIQRTEETERINIATWWQWCSDVMSASFFILWNVIHREGLLTRLLHIVPILCNQRGAVLGQGSSFTVR